MLERIQPRLPASATAVDVCPVLIPTGPIKVAMRRPAADAAESVELATETVVVVPEADAGGAAVSTLTAIGTRAGTVDIAGTTKGLAQPLAMSVLSSFKVLRSPSRPLFACPMCFSRR